MYVNKLQLDIYKGRNVGDPKKNARVAQALRSRPREPREQAHEFCPLWPVRGVDL